MIARGARAAIAVAVVAAALAAQQGDVKGEVQQELPPGLVVPPAVVRSAGEELATFAVQPGFHVELIAAEPLIHDPVAATVAPDGRMWVVEMRSYMRDVDAGGERTPDGRIVVLSDRDGDGRMDTVATFCDGLVLPRAVLPLPGGALAIAPPQLLWLEDRDGDGAVDHRTELAGGFEAGILNPEHSGNGLLWALDNRIHLADDRRMLRWSPQGFAIEQGAGGGQWGIAQDDRGRLFYNYNEDWLRADLVPGRYRVPAKGLGSFLATNFRVVTDTSVWPIRVTPGVNRGYQPGMLKDGVLTRHTAVCSPHVARGDRMADARGDVFVCEPAANLVRRFRLAQLDGNLRGTNVYERAEFLASTDERFRPVHLFALADGSLGLVDMYRGVIQHRNFVTTFLRKQITARGLEQPTGLGRIWRLVADGPARAVRPLQQASAIALVQALGEHDGWTRDTAQRLLVLRQEHSAVPALRQLLRTASLPASRCHAAAVLAALGALDSNDLRTMLWSDDPAVLTFALQNCAPKLTARDAALWAQLERLVAHPARTVRWHLASALGEVDGPAAARALTMLAQVGARMQLDDPVLRDCICAAAARREAALVRALVDEPAFDVERNGLIVALATMAGRDRDGDATVRLGALLDASAACMKSWQQMAVLQGLVEALPNDKAAQQGYYTFAVTPPALHAMARTGNPEVQALVQQMLSAIALRPDAVAAPNGVDDLDLPEAARAQVAAGGKVYAAVCAACHQLDGGGLGGLAPPLRNSEWVTGAPERLARIALHGLRGPVTAAGVAFAGEMPGQAWLGDVDLAAALSYLRRSFGHRATVIDAATIAALRAQYAARTEPWTAAELQAK